MSPKLIHFMSGSLGSAAQYSAAAELDVLANNVRFNDWIAELLRPALSGCTLEVGAGIGTMSVRFAPYVAHLLSIEPAENLETRLKSATSAHSNVEVRTALSSDVHERDFNAITYVSVLEHIEDDGAELRLAHQLLAPSGRLAIFVPAMPSLYGTIDRLSDHYRRYTRGGLETIVREAGFAIDQIHYLDVASVVPYWLAYRVVKIKTLGGGSGALFDRLLVPASRAVQRVWRRPPFGKNLVCLATKQ